jgi:hypothetical protein
MRQNLLWAIVCTGCLMLVAVYGAIFGLLQIICLYGFAVFLKADGMTIAEQVRTKKSHDIIAALMAVSIFLPWLLAYVSLSRKSADISNFGSILLALFLVGNIFQLATIAKSRIRIKQLAAHARAKVTAKQETQFGFGRKIILQSPAAQSIVLKNIHPENWASLKSEVKQPKSAINIWWLSGIMFILACIAFTMFLFRDLLIFSLMFMGGIVIAIFQGIS